MFGSVNNSLVAVMRNDLHINVWKYLLTEAGLYCGASLQGIFNTASESFILWIGLKAIWFYPQLLRRQSYVVCLDVGAQSVARCRAVKRAYRLAVENAFSQLLLVVLDNGKVFVDVTDAAVPSQSDGDCHSQILPVFCINLFLKFPRLTDCVSKLVLVKADNLIQQTALPVRLSTENRYSFSIAVVAVKLLLCDRLWSMHRDV